MSSLNTTKRSNAMRPTRRTLLKSLVTAYTASLIPWALAEPVDSADQGAFVAMSAIIAGRQTLDSELAKNLYRALLADDPNFASAVMDLLALVNERKSDPLALQKMLDDERSPLAPVPRKIATAWFMGVVGSGEHARCLAYENALNAIIVADVLKPPTYAYGPYGSWAKNPNEEVQNV
ncbi:sorbitol dehydrogenase family protein [Pseudomonas gingeri]|nr:sorbitol dehydrogenase family protein [Pseudomonas gingeri]